MTVKAQVVTPYDTIKEKINVDFPDWVNESNSSNMSIYLPKVTKANLWIRNNGNIILNISEQPGGGGAKYDAWARRALERLKKIEVSLAGKGYIHLGDPLDVEATCEIGVNIYREHVTWDVQLGTSQLIHIIDGKRTVVKEHDLIDRVNVGFFPFSWNHQIFQREGEIMV